MFHILKNCSKIVQKSSATHNFMGAFSSKFHSKSVKEVYRQTFQRLDLNNDGFITQEDLKWTISILGYGEGIIALMGYTNNDHLAQSMMIALDKRKKGTVDLEVLVDFIKTKCPSEEQIIQRFNQLDKDEDGFVNRNDLRESLVQNHKNIPDMVLDDLVEKQMTLYDKDKNGYITMNEYISAWYYLDVVGALILKEPPEPLNVG